MPSPNNSFVIPPFLGILGQANNALQQAEANYQANLAALNEAYALKKKKIPYPGLKEDPSSSQMIYTLQIPEALLESSLESIDRELAERASALAEISKQLEVVEETDSLIRHHISNLRMGASHFERKKVKKPPSYQYQPELEPAEDFEHLAGVAQPAATAEWLTAQQLSPAGQG